MRRTTRLVALLLLVAMAACSKGDPFKSLPTPKTVVTEATTTTTEPDLTGVQLDGVPGATTTTIAVGPGPMTIVGKVEGPDGAIVPDAIVELQRIVGTATAIAKVPTAPDGTWNLANVLGGRYRIRAWRAPDLVTTNPQVVFLESGPERAVSLKLDELGGVRVDSAIAPDPPVVGEDVNLKVRVAERTVDREGVVRDEPQPGETVTLSGAGEWSVSSPNPSTTGGDGSTIFRMTCQDAGAQSLFATLSSGASYPLVIQPCVSPAPTTTTTSSSTTTTSP